jgi:iron complex transport system ATP-binding protein
VTAAIALHDVRAGYGATDVLVGLDLEIARGELFGLLGPNGCGKTTLLRVVSGVLRPRAGRVEVLGTDVASSRPRELARRVAVVPQDSAPVFAMAALEVVLLGRHPWHPAFAFETRADVDAARGALAEVAAESLADREFTTLSGGERQRVLLARGLCQGGEVLLCDEPTAHLDVRHQAATFRLLRALAAKGRTAVVVTHDVDLAAQACDRVALFGAHGLIACGAPRDVITTARLAEAFGIAADVHLDPAGRPLVVRRLDEGKGPG